MKITIPLGFRKKKKKVYCKKCLWKDDGHVCEVYKNVDDHNSKRHHVKIKQFYPEKQNENNDCKFYCFNFFWWL